MVLTRSAGRAERAKQAAKAAFRILDLPPELVGLDFGQLAELDPYTLLDARYVCRAFQAHSVVAFGTTFFHHVIAMLHPLSLNILLEIATHAQLSKFVDNVTLSGERVGGMIDLSEQPDGQKLKDLQTSMELSGLDRIILCEVFRQLSNLKVVRIDNHSFHSETDRADAARCGRRQIVTEGTEYDWHRREWNEYGFNCAFGVAFACFHKAGLEGKVDIHMHANINDQVSHYHDFFNPTSSEWKDNIAANVKLLRLCRDLSSGWALDLFQSVPNLQELEIFIAEGILELSHPDTGLFIWPRLHHLEIDDATCDGLTMGDFLDAHKSSLSELHLQGVEFTHSSWVRPLQIVQYMPKLEYLYICDLTEHTPPPQLGVPFENFYSSYYRYIYNF